ncbi:replication initiator protein A [Salmonella enterica]|nr:replication initiator protein A [Salmonella enterica]
MPHDFETIGGALGESLQRLHDSMQKAKARQKAEAPAAGDLFGAADVALPAGNASSLRVPPEGDEQPDFFVPSLFDIPVKDGVDLMDVAVFRLSKSQTRRGEIIRYELADAVVEVAGGAHGMATIWDYDVVLMMISHLADAIRRHRAGKDPVPSRRFRPHSVEILKFCRLPDGGQQYENLSKTLDRLQGTFVKIEHRNPDPKSKKRRTGYFPLLGGAEVVSYTDTGKVGQVELVIPEWIYDGVCGHDTPEVLTVDPDYLLIRGGLARFIYRLARKAAGRTEARYNFRTVHQRSGSTRDFKKFVFDLRQLIEANDLPGYGLSETKGSDGPVLVMQSRTIDAQANS